MPTRTEHIPCPSCGVPRPVVVTGTPSSMARAHTRKCADCGKRQMRAKRYPQDVDELAVKYLIAGTRINATPAERAAAVALLAAEQLTTKAIADRLHCTTRTVERHRAKLAAA